MTKENNNSNHVLNTTEEKETGVTKDIWTIGLNLKNNLSKKLKFFLGNKSFFIKASPTDKKLQLKDSRSENYVNIADETSTDQKLEKLENKISKIINHQNNPHLYRFTTCLIYTAKDFKGHDPSSHFAAKFSKKFFFNTYHDDEHIKVRENLNVLKFSPGVYRINLAFPPDRLKYK